MEQDLERSDTPGCAAVMNAKLGLYMGWWASIINLNEDCKYQLRIPASIGRFILTGNLPVNMNRPPDAGMRLLYLQSSWFLLYCHLEEAGCSLRLTKFAWLRDLLREGEVCVVGPAEDGKNSCSGTFHLRFSRVYVASWGEMGR